MTKKLASRRFFARLCRAASPFQRCGRFGHGASARAQTTLTVAMAANPQMETAEKLIDAFNAKYPDIKVKFQTLPENELRPTVLKDVATNAGQFDVVMIGSYEVPLWAQKGWVHDLSKDYIPADPGYDVADLTKPIADIVSYKGNLTGCRSMVRHPSLSTGRISSQKLVSRCPSIRPGIRLRVLRIS